MKDREFEPKSFQREHKCPHNMASTGLSVLIFGQREQRDQLSPVFICYNLSFSCVFWGFLVCLFFLFQIYIWVKGKWKGAKLYSVLTMCLTHELGSRISKFEVWTWVWLQVLLAAWSNHLNSCSHSFIFIKSSFVKTNCNVPKYCIK